MVAPQRKSGKSRSLVGLQEHAKFVRLYNFYRRVSGGGADGRVMGVNGSVNPRSVHSILCAMQVPGRTVFDFGCSEGRFLLSAALQGACKAVGVELPENVGYRFLFDSVKKTLESSAVHLFAEWIGLNIEQVLAICLIFMYLRLLFSCFCAPFQMKRIPQNPQAVYAFWVGFSFSTQYHILELCSKTPSIDTIAVFRDYKWTQPQEGIILLSSMLLAFN